MKLCSVMRIRSPPSPSYEKKLLIAWIISKIFHCGALVAPTPSEKVMQADHVVGETVCEIIVSLAIFLLRYTSKDFGSSTPVPRRKYIAWSTPFSRTKPSNHGATA